MNKKQAVVCRVLSLFLLVMGAVYNDGHNGHEVPVLLLYTLATLGLLFAFLPFIIDKKEDDRAVCEGRMRSRSGLS
jgi:hypothetical protein